MPVYDMECDQCKKIKEIWAKVDEESVSCRCGGVLKRLISATRSNPDWQPYYDENLGPQHGNGSIVKSRQHRKELMKQYGLADKWSGC